MSTVAKLLAAVSLPDQDPAHFKDADEADRFDRVTGGVFELGSIAKIVTLGLALDELGATSTRFYDTREPLHIGRHTIAEQHPPNRPLTLAEILIRSSNVGAGLIAMEAGVDRQRAFLDRLGLLDTIRTEAGRVAPPLLPSNWGPIEGVTISFGHGLAVAPLQFAAVAASLVNGGIKVRPTFLQQDTVPPGEARVVSAATSAAIRDALRRVVRTPTAPAAAPTSPATKSAARPAPPSNPVVAAINPRPSSRRSSPCFPPARPATSSSSPSSNRKASKKQRAASPPASTPRRPPPASSNASAPCSASSPPNSPTRLYEWRRSATPRARGAPLARRATAAGAAHYPVAPNNTLLERSKWVAIEDRAIKCRPARQRRGRGSRRRRGPRIKKRSWFDGSGGRTYVARGGARRSEAERCCFPI